MTASQEKREIVLQGVLFVAIIIFFSFCVFDGKKQGTALVVDYRLASPVLRIEDLSQINAKDYDFVRRKDGKIVEVGYGRMYE